MSYVFGSFKFQTIRFVQMMSLTFGLFTQVSDSGSHGPLVSFLPLSFMGSTLIQERICSHRSKFFPLSLDPLLEGYIFKNSKQDVT